MPDAGRLQPRELVEGTRIVFARELEAYFDSPIAYIYATVFLVLSCTTFMNSFFLDAVVDMSPYFELNETPVSGKLELQSA